MRATNLKWTNEISGNRTKHITWYQKNINNLTDHNIEENKYFFMFSKVAMTISVLFICLTIAVRQKGLIRRRQKGLKRFSLVENYSFTFFSWKKSNKNPSAEAFGRILVAANALLKAITHIPMLRHQPPPSRDVFLDVYYRIFFQTFLSFVH